MPGFPAPQQQKPQAAAPVPQAAPPQDFIAMFIQALQANQQQQNQLGQGRLQLQNDQTFGRHLDMGGRPITGDQNPFTNGMFEDAPTRFAKMSGYNEPVGIPTRTDAPRNPYGFGAITPIITPPIPQDPNGFNPTTRAIPGGFEGMISTNLPDDQKYADPNFFTAKPNFGFTPSKSKVNQQKGKVSFGSGRWDR